MKEKIAVRIVEVQIWGQLVENLDMWEKVARSDLEGYDRDLKEEYPDGGKEMQESWKYREMQTCKTKLAAIENIRATIFKAMG